MIKALPTSAFVTNTDIFDEYRAYKMSEFDPNKAGVLMVTPLQEDGKYHILDGGVRVALAIRSGYTGKLRVMIREKSPVLRRR